MELRKCPKPTCHTVPATPSETRQVTYLFSALLPNGNRQPLSVSISRDWIPTSASIVLHFSHGSMDCDEESGEDQDEGRKQSQSQTLALCFHEDWTPTGMLRLYLEDMNCISWMLDDVVHPALVPLPLSPRLGGDTGRDSRAARLDGFTYMRLTLTLTLGSALLSLLIYMHIHLSTTITSKYLHRVISDIHDTYPLALLPLRTPSPTDAVYIHSPGITLESLGEEVQTFCSYIRWWQDVQTPSFCGDAQGSARWNLLHASELYGVMMPNMLVRGVTIELLRLETWVNTEDEMRRVDEVALFVTNYLSYLRPLHDGIVERLSKSCHLLRSTVDLIERDIMPLVNDLLSSHPNAVDTWTLDAIDARRYITLILMPQVTILLQRLDHALQELTTAIDLIRNLKEAALIVSSTKQPRTYINTAQLVQSLHSTIRFSISEAKADKATQEMIDAVADIIPRPQRPSQVQWETARRRKKMRVVEIEEEEGAWSRMFREKLAGGGGRFINEILNFR